MTCGKYKIEQLRLSYKIINILNLSFIAFSFFSFLMIISLMVEFVCVHKFVIYNERSFIVASVRIKSYSLGTFTCI